ncbi:hypothetical protein J6590_021268 [Homalodisca vitripennis]|nr:hypothetical protein J6590_021268 [Homalodisca vitripennis]
MKRRKYKNVRETNSGNQDQERRKIVDRPDWLRRLTIVPDSAVPVERATSCVTYLRNLVNSTCRHTASLRGCHGQRLVPYDTVNKSPLF